MNINIVPIAFSYMDFVAAIATLICSIAVYFFYNLTKWSIWYLGQKHYVIVVSLFCLWGITLIFLTLFTITAYLMLTMYLFAPFGAVGGIALACLFGKWIIEKIFRKTPNAINPS